MPLAFETNGGPPAFFPCHPLHTGYAAGIVLANGFSLEHFDTSTVYIVQIQTILFDAAAALGVAVAQMVRLDHDLIAAIATATPRRAPVFVVSGA